MEEYLKQKHAETYMGTDDNMPEAFTSWLERLDTDELIAYADEFNQSLVGRVSENLTKDLVHPEFCKFRGDQYKECTLCYIEKVLSINQ